MSVVAFAIFWVAVIVLMWVYVGYPLTAWLAGRVRPVRVAPATTWPALVTVGIAVHNGESHVASRIANVLEQEVPFATQVIVASDGSTDQTARIVERAARQDSRVSLLELQRSGQSAAQSAIFNAARGDVVVLSDVETRFAPGCLEALVAPLADGRVGCVTGVLGWRTNEISQTVRGEGLYWRYELRVRGWESRAGWLSAGTGALLAVRRSLYRAAPAHASLDQMLPLIARQAGLMVLVAPSAVGSDRGPVTLHQQFASRTRIATQGIEANLRALAGIAPWRTPGVFVAIWSHKILRWATPYLGFAAALSGIALAVSERSAGYAVPSVAAGAVLLLAGLNLCSARLGRPVPATGFALTVVAVNLAFALGWLNVMLGRKMGAWER